MSSILFYEWRRWLTMTFRKPLLILLTAIAAILALIGSIHFLLSERSKGYDDGYAVGYNTTCNLKQVATSGHFLIPTYSSAFAEGVIAGIISCNDFRNRKGDRQRTLDNYR